MCVFSILAIDACTMLVTELRDIIRNSPSHPGDESLDWDPYSETSSFYGPGAFLCWMLVTLSYLVKWSTARTPGTSFPLTSDFVAMLAYPAIAAVHMLLLATAFPPAERHQLMGTMVAVRSSMNATTLTADVVKDMDTLRRCVTLAVPLRVCELSFYPGLIILVCELFLRPDATASPAYEPVGQDRGSNSRCCILVPRIALVHVAYTAVYFVTVTALLVVACIGWSSHLGDYIGHVMASHFMALIILVGPLAMLICSAVQIVRMKNWNFWGLLCCCTREFNPSAAVLFLLGVLILASQVCLFITPLVIVGLAPSILVLLLSFAVPDVGASLLELDQAAAASVEFITLGITLHEASKIIPDVERVIKKWKSHFRSRGDENGIRLAGASSSENHDCPV